MKKRTTRTKTSQAADITPAFYSTDTAIAEAAGLSRQEFYAFKKRDGDRFPKKKSKGWDVNEVVNYLWETGRIGKACGDVALDLHKERARKMKADADKQELVVKQMQNELLPAEEVYRKWSQGWNDVDSRVKKSNAAQARKLEGMKAADILTSLNEAWYEVRKQVSES